MGAGQCRCPLRKARCKRGSVQKGGGLLEAKERAAGESGTRPVALPWLPVRQMSGCHCAPPPIAE